MLNADKMDELIKKAKEMEKGSVGIKVKSRLAEFKEMNKLSAEDWFSELCFCILTANSKFQTAFNIQNELDFKGFANLSENEVAARIRSNKHRFHNTKAKFIVKAREHLDIKQKITDLIKNKSSGEAREWIVKNIKGIGFKEASHFLRNVGYFDLAILDRHILNLMAEKGHIIKPKSMTPKNYVEIEKKFIELSEEAGMKAGELDLYMWCMKTGEVMK